MFDVDTTQERRKMPCNEERVESDGQILKFTTMPVQVKEWVSCTKPVQVLVPNDKER